VIILVLGIQLIMLSLMLRIEGPVLSPVLGGKLTVETTVLSLRHMLFMCCPMLSVKVLMVSLMLSIQVLVFGTMLGVEPFMHRLMFIMGKDLWGRPQQASERKYGQGHFF